MEATQDVLKKKKRMTSAAKERPDGQFQKGYVSDRAETPVME